MKNTLMTVMMTSISEVLETMFFLPAEQQEDRVLSGSGLLENPDTLSAELSFSGDVSGRLIMVVPGGLLAEMTENFMGESTDRLSRALMEGTLTELLNMVCGNALRKLDAGHSFDLGIPAMLDISSVPSDLPAAVMDVSDTRIASILEIQD